MQLTIDTRNSTRVELRQAAGLLLAIAEGVEPVGANLSGALPIGSLGLQMPPSQAERSQALSTVVQNLAEAGRIAPEDNPSAGIPSAAEAFPGNGLPGVPVVQPTAAQAFVQSAPTLPQAQAPATPPAAPSAPTVPAGAPAGVQLDKRGLPWDGRIHAKAEGGGGVITKEGLWRAKRGLNDDGLVKRIEAELLQALAAPAVMPPPPPAFVPGANAPVFPDGVPPAPPVAAAPPAPLQAPAGALPTTLPQLMGLCAPVISKKLLTMEEVVAAAVLYGVPSIPALASRADIIPLVWQQLQHNLAQR